MPLVSELDRLERSVLVRRLIETEERLAKTEATIESLRSLNERFASMSTRSPESEARVRPFLDRLFHSTAGQGSYELECRAKICKVSINRDKLPPEGEDWDIGLQTDPEAVGLFKNLTIENDAAHLEIDDSGVAAGNRLALEIMTAFRVSPEFKSCREQQGQGSLTLSLEFDSAKRRIHVRTEGNLENQAVGVCLRRALEEVVAATPIPSNVTVVPQMPLKLEKP